jgi:hypothetical protein
MSDVRRQYVNPPRLSRDVAVAKLRGTERLARIDGLLSLALYDPDWKWVQERCLELLHDPDPDIVATAILALGHVGRLHGQLDLDRVVPELEALKTNEALAGRVSDVMNDIDIFVRRLRSDR